MFLRTTWLCLAAFGACAIPVFADDLSASSGDLKVEAGADHIDFLVKGKLVGRYECGPKVAKPYLWPLNSPAGVPITRAWPMEPGEAGGSRDHVHQKSAWFCHGDIIPEGIELKDKVKGVTGVDFWSEAKGHGVIVCTSKGPIRIVDNHAQVATHNEWRTADGIKLLDEDRVIHFQPFGDAYLFTFDIDLAATAAPITFGDTKEGSFGIRINDALREKGGKGKLTTANGNTGMAKIWGTKSAWCDYSGKLNDKMVGLAIFDDPTNNPQSCWHSRDYGLMSANPFGRAKSGFPAVKGDADLVKLAKDAHLKLRYGIFVHPGDAKDGKVAEHFELFAKKSGE
jgi:hypothetical protein